MWPERRIRIISSLWNDPSWGFQFIYCRSTSPNQAFIFVMSKSSKNSSSSKWNSSNFRSWLLVNDSSPWAAWSFEKHPTYSTRLEGNYCSNVGRTSPSDWLGVDRLTLFHRWISDFFGLNGTKKTRTILIGDVLDSSGSGCFPLNPWGLWRLAGRCYGLVVWNQSLCYLGDSVEF